MENHTQVGVGVLIYKDNMILLGRRKGSHGAGSYATPGGKLEYMESFSECALRETYEECGVTIKDIEFVFVGNIKLWKPKHFVHIQLRAKWDSGDPVVKEPEKVDSWDWYELNSLPSPLFGTLPLALESINHDNAFYDDVK